MTDFISPGSAAWQKLITPSKVPAILGVSRFKPQYTLWHEMAGRIEPAPVSVQQQDDFDYGHAAEMAAAEYWRIKNPGWRISRGEVQFTNPKLPFPHLATIDRRASRGRGRRVVEIKTARDLAEYGDDGTGIVPADYAAQVITQQMITGWIADADLVCWPQFGKPRIYKVPFDPDVAAAIIERCAEWMQSINDGTPPDLDDSISTYETVRALHPDIDDVDVPIDRELAVDYLTAVDDAKQADKKLTGLKSQLLTAMGRGRRATVGNHKIADRRPGRGDRISLYANPKSLKEIAA